MIHLMPCWNPCRLYMHLAFTYFIGPSSIVCEANLDWLHQVSHQWECLKCNGHGPPISCMWTLNWPSLVMSVDHFWSFKRNVDFWVGQLGQAQCKVETPYHDNDLILTPIILPQSGWQWTWSCPELHMGGFRDGGWQFLAFRRCH
jgi:hypothetical protein